MLDMSASRPAVVGSDQVRQRQGEARHRLPGGRATLHHSSPSPHGMRYPTSTHPRRPRALMPPRPRAAPRPAPTHLFPPPSFISRSLCRTKARCSSGCQPP